MSSFAIYLKAPSRPEVRALEAAQGDLGRAVEILSKKAESKKDQNLQLSWSQLVSAGLSGLRSGVKWAWAKSGAKADDAGHGLRGACSAQRLATLWQCG